MTPGHGPERSARDTARAVRQRDLSAREVVAEALAAIAVRDRELRAFTDLDAERALSAADEVDRRVAAGESLALAGVPVGVKELVAVAGLRQGYGTPAMPAQAATRDAACVSRLRATGAIAIGVTRTSELAWRNDTPPTRNPLDATLSCGGSSGGSAAAVAAGLVPLAVGTDTGGSIRYPAALCGCCGHKPTAGAVPLDGVLPVSPSLDHVGPLARSVDDLRLALAALSGREEASPRDPRPRLGVPVEPAAIVDGAVATAFDALLNRLREAGVVLVPQALLPFEAATAAVATISLAEGAEIFAGALAAPPGSLSDESRAELQGAPRRGGAACRSARRTGASVRRQVQQLLDEHRLDAILLPALTVPAPARAAPPDTRPPGALLALANVTGQPACVVPVARRPLPFALQLLGRSGSDEELLSIAAIVEAIAGER